MRMAAGLRAALGGLVLGTALAGCGSDAAQLDTGKQALAEVRRMLGAVIKPLGKDKVAAAPGPDAEAIAREGMALNAGPVLIATLDANGSTSLFAQRGENGSMRTWLAASGQGVITRDGLLVGTRGFGNDLMSADMGALAALVRGRHAGNAQVELRHLDGLGIERATRFSCTVGTGSAASYSFAGLDLSGLQVAAHCAADSASFDASFIVSDTGRVIASRQWIGPQLGYLTIQGLRD